MSSRFLQANVNHAARAQDLLLQSMTERRISWAAVAEPYRVPSGGGWISDVNDDVALIPGEANSFSLVHRGIGYVVGTCGDLAVVGVYARPSWPLDTFEAMLDEIGTWVRNILPAPIIVLGDFNAKSTTWGNRAQNARGAVLETWAAMVDLHLLNNGGRATCVRMGGSSVVDITWASRAVVRRVTAWCVLEDVETLSDHVYIQGELDGLGSDVRIRCFRRWALTALDEDAMTAAALALEWSNRGRTPVTDVNAAADWLDRAMASICDASMPRVTGRSRPAVYWWTDAIRDKRIECLRARRDYARSRRRAARDRPEERRLWIVYSHRRAELAEEISSAKREAWQELLDGLDGDPWGRPYRIVLGKLRKRAPPVTQSTDEDTLEGILSTLFPDDGGGGLRRLDEEDDETEEPEELIPPVTDFEVSTFVRRFGSARKAPGPDGVPGRIWAKVAPMMGPSARRLMDACLRSRRFPDAWKTGGLVLLPKKGKPAGDPSAYRPICLLSEAAKALERVITSRLESFLRDKLSPGQYGFRRGMSTMHAIEEFRRVSQLATDEGGVALAASLDIANAFNSLPWWAVRAELRGMGAPLYLRRLVEDYFRGRAVLLPTRDGMKRRTISRGVPQGSVLGPLLWTVGYDSVLRSALPPGVSIVCYADDTLVVARERDWGRCSRLLERGVSTVVAAIQRLELTVAAAKTEVMWCHNLPLRREPPLCSVAVAGARIAVRGELKYLGLIIDSRWRFSSHFKNLRPRVQGVAALLAGLLPNLGGPGIRVRRLYMEVIKAMALYGCPIWAKTLERMKPSRDCLASMQRLAAIRIVRGYRSLSHDTAAVLAGVPPLEFQARALSDVYWFARDLGNSDSDDGRDLHEFRRAANRLAMVSWQHRLQETGAVRHRAVAAVLPVLREWCKRRHGVLTYRVTQFLTGHGAFGEFLARIGAERTPACARCGAPVETPEHVLKECPAFASERARLMAVIGPTLEPGVVVRKMTFSARAWKAVEDFAQETLTRIERDERDREFDGADPRRSERRRERARLRRRGRPPNNN